MSERDNSVSFSVEDYDGLCVERENRELASSQVRQINDTLRKVHRITRAAKQLPLQVIEEVPLGVPYIDHELLTKSITADVEPSPRKERDDSTGKFLIPAPTLASPVSEVFRKAIELFQSECAQFKGAVGKGSAIVRTWKLV